MPDRSPEDDKTLAEVLSVPTNTVCPVLTM